MHVFGKIFLTMCWLFSSLFFTGPMASCTSNDTPKPIEKPDEEEEPVEDNFNYVYKEETGGFQVYRIPAIVKTKGGKLLAFAEARKLRSNGDSGDIDMVVKISADQGASWSDMITIWDDGLNTCGNPVPIVDETSGRIHLLMTWNHGEDTWGTITNGTGNDTRRVFYTWSDDEGETWQAPVEITADVKGSTWDWYGTGPVHGIQLKKGPHKDRLLAPNYYTTKVNGQRKDYAHVVYSDDHGATWKPGKSTLADNAGECTLAELSDGRLLLNVRVGTGAARMYCISEDGGETWGAMQTDYTLIDPKCQGSLLAATVAGKQVLFFANAASAERRNMTVKWSNDDGVSWTKQFLVHEGPSAYSDLVMATDDSILLLYEGGINRPYEGIALMRIGLSDFK